MEDQWKWTVKKMAVKSLKGMKVQALSKIDELNGPEECVGGV